MAGKLLRLGLTTLPLLVACTGPTGDPGDSPPPAPSPTASPATPATSPAPEPSPTASPTARPFDGEAAITTVRTLAGFGPREATGEAFDRAADHVRQELSGWGYSVSTQEFEVPAGDSWGVAVPAGTSYNLIADPPGFTPDEPHVVIGAHLDTVPQSPGAEDNASGVAVTLELARMTAEQPASLPVRFIIFGAEEPRGPGDDLHHFGSTAHATGPDRGEIRAMVSLDRVGVPAEAVPVAYGGSGSAEVRDALADHAPVPVSLGENTTSDHWSYEKAGVPAARLGSVPFEGYHTPDDLPDAVDAEQLTRTAQVVWAWLRAL